MTERIYLIGYMGSGKSTIGRRLAKTLGYQFVDMDLCIEERYRKKISDLFAEGGEASFRTKERFILEELSGDENVVISTGGGSPCFFDNIDVMNNSGATVYIRMSAEKLTERLRCAKSNRPLLKEKTEDELTEYIKEHLKERSVFYEKAQFKIDNDNLSADEASDKIASMLKDIG